MVAAGQPRIPLFAFFLKRLRSRSVVGMALSVQGCVRVAEPLPLAHRGRAFLKQARVAAPQLGQPTSHARRVREVVAVQLQDKDLGLRFAAALVVVLLHSSEPPILER